jgi:hypothetical protein
MNAGNIGSFGTPRVIAATAFAALAPAAAALPALLSFALVATTRRSVAVRDLSLRQGAPNPIRVMTAPVRAPRARAEPERWVESLRARPWSGC